MKNILLVTFFFLISFTTAFSQQWKTHSDSASAQLKRGDYKGAIENYVHARNLLAKENKRSDDYITLCLSLGVVYANNRDAENAGLVFLDAKNIAEQLHTKMDKGYARAATFLANIYTNLRRYNEAEALFLEAKDIREKLYGRISEEYAQTINNLGDLYRTTGRYEEAEPFSIEARQIRGTVHRKTHAAYGISTVALANLYRDMGQYEKAEPLYIEAKQIRQDTFGKINSQYAASCNILADLYSMMGKYKEAESLYLEARDVREQVFKTKIHSDYAQSNNNLANLYVQTGRYKEAEALALEASKIWKEKLPPGHESHANGYAALGNIYFALGDYVKAEEYLTKARTAWEKTLEKTHPIYVANTIELAKVYWQQQKFQKASEFFTEAIQAQKSQIENFFAFTNEREKEAFLQNVSGAGHEYYSFAWQNVTNENAAQVYDVSLLKRNLILTSSQQIQFFVDKEGSKEIQAKYNDWISIKDKMARMLSQSSNNEKEIKELEENAEKLEKELAKSSAAFAQQQAEKKTVYQNIRQQLKPNEAAIEFIEFNYFNGKKWTDSSFYMAVILKKNNPHPQLVKLFEKKQLENIISIKGKNSEQVANALYAGNRDIYNLVWRPLEKSLQGITKIYFAPAGLLHRISLAALPVTNKQLLSDKYQLVQLNTTASVTEPITSPVTTADKIVLYGGVEYSVDSAELRKEASVYHTSYSYSRSLPEDLSRGEKWNLLPGSQKEIAQIAQLGKQKGFQIKSFQGIHATEESVEELKGKASPAILHIATHGFFYADPKQDTLSAKFATSGRAFKQSNNPLFRSGLLLAGANLAWENKAVKGIDDGILTAYEVSNLYLPNTKLVVLSACETALGDIQGSEGVYGLQRAFKMAGVQNLVMSIWKVPDAETAEFMQEFYRHLFNKQAISDAFYHAQTTMKNKYRNEPYKWAAWVLVR